MAPLANGDNFLIGFLPALSGGDFQTKQSVGAFMYAIEKVNETQYLGDHTLDYILEDNNANTKLSIRKMTSLYSEHHVHAFIGPEDTCQDEALIAASWNVPMIVFVSKMPLIAIIIIRLCGTFSTCTSFFFFFFF